MKVLLAVLYHLRPAPPGCGRKLSGRLASQPEGRSGLHYRPARPGHAQRRRQGRCAAWCA
eukprot:415563-Pleurochrysis_carterae.AAC.1